MFITTCHKFMGPLSFYTVKWFLRHLLPVYLEWWNGFKWILEWCGVRKNVGYIGQPYFLRLYCITDTFFSAALLQHPLETTGILEYCHTPFFHVYREILCCLFSFQWLYLRNQNCSKEQSKIVWTDDCLQSCRNWYCCWFHLTVITSSHSFQQEYFLLTIGLICAVSFKKKRNFKIVCMVFGVWRNWRITITGTRGALRLRLWKKQNLSLLFYIKLEL